MPDNSAYEPIQPTEILLEDDIESAEIQPAEIEIGAEPPQKADIPQMLGLHPLVGFGMFAIDLMLFAETAATFGAGWVISIPVAAALSIPSILLQKYSFGDDWGAAIGKGLMVGVLTAIPTPIPSLISVSGGVLGAMKMLKAPSDPK